MNINQLKYFNCICNCGSISAASELLHISQPSLSIAVKELETEFGLSLFKRSHYGVRLTASGEIFLKKSKELIRDFDSFEAYMHSLGNESTHLRLGMPPMVGYILFPKIYAVFSKKYPDISIETTEGGRIELLRKIYDGYIDIAFLPHTAPFEDDLSSFMYTRFEVVFCTKKTNKSAFESKIKISDIADTPLVLFKNSFFQTMEIKKLFSSAHAEPKILFQTEQLSTMQSMIESGIASGFIFRELIEENENLKIIPLENPLYVNVSLVWKKSSHITGGMQAIKDIIATLS